MKIENSAATAYEFQMISTSDFKGKSPTNAIFSDIKKWFGCFREGIKKVDFTALKKRG